jgi:hypothetical protein
MSLHSSFTTINASYRLTNGGAANNCLYDVCSTILSYYETHPGFQRIAWNSGSVGGGLDPQYGASPVKENAWFVYRAVSSSTVYDVAIKVATGAYDTGQNAWKTDTDTGLAIGISWHSSSASWQGTTANNGSDAFSDAGKPWKSGSITGQRINGTSGTHVTTKNGLVRLLGPSIGTSVNVAVTGDNDYTIIHAAPNRDGFLSSTDLRRTLYYGTYTAFSSSYSIPLCVAELSVLTDYESGASNTTTTTYGGGLVYTSSIGTIQFGLCGTGVPVQNNVVDPSLATHEMSSVVNENPVVAITSYTVGSEDYPSLETTVKLYGRLKGIGTVSYNAHSFRYYDGGRKLTIYDGTRFQALAWNSASLGVVELNLL